MLIPWYARIQNGLLENSSAAFWKISIWAIYLIKSIVIEANRLEPRSGPTKVGPDLGSSLFTIVQKYWYISIPNRMGYSNETIWYVWKKSVLLCMISSWICIISFFFKPNFSCCLLILQTTMKDWAIQSQFFSFINFLTLSMICFF